MLSHAIKPDSDAEESQFEPLLLDKDSKQCHEKLQELFISRKNMQNFIAKIAEKKIGIENNVIYNFCNKYEKMPVQGKSVICLLQKRIERMMKNKKIKKNWSADDLDILIWTTTYYAELYKIDQIENMKSKSDWQNIADLIPGTTGQSCMFKILGFKKVRLSDQNWSTQQSNLLFEIVTNSDKVDWKKASQQLFVKNSSRDRAFRSAKQCKEHWSCYLNPQLKKGPWMIDEDILLLDNILRSNGKKRWTQLAKIFQGRTQNALKNRFSLLIDRQKIDSTQQQIQQISEVLEMLRQQRRNLVRLNVLKDDPKITNQHPKYIPQDKPQKNEFKKGQAEKQDYKKKKSKIQDSQFNPQSQIQPPGAKNLFKSKSPLGPEDMPTKRKSKKLAQQLSQKSEQFPQKWPLQSQMAQIKPTDSTKIKLQSESSFKIEPINPSFNFQPNFVYNLQPSNFYPPVYNQYFMIFNPNQMFQ